MGFLLFILLFIPIVGAPGVETSAPKPLVIVSVPPYLHFVKAFVGEDVETISIVPPGVDPHTYEPLPKEMQNLIKADLWIRLGEPFDNRVHSVLLAAKPHLSCLTLSEELPPGTQDPQDPHIWLSPRLAKIQATSIANALTRLLPNKQSQINSALEALLQQLDACDQALRTHAASKKGGALLLSHPSLGYFCRDYGITQLALERTDREPGPKDFITLLQNAKEHLLLGALLEPHCNNKGIHLIADNLHVRTYPFDPCSEDIMQNFQNLDGILSQ